ncbi:MAG: PD-(D/E)XK nuclease family protein [Elusimicrobia bacterium]|nr:PD-(D/E)XK nuclease family protein [Elusimicrobiota bacterium]
MIKNLLIRLSEIFIPGMDISYSRINAYQLCPFKYNLIYREGWRVSPTPFTSLGLSIHRALEEFHSSRSDNIEFLIDSYNKNWVNVGFSSPQETKEFFDKGLRMLENYFEEQEKSKSEIMFIEKSFRFKLGRNFIIGIIDRIDKNPDGTYELIDYKTHIQLWDQEKADSDLQLTIYSIACEKAFGFNPDILSYYFLAFNTKVSTSRTKEQIRQAGKLIENITRKIYKENFEPNTQHCSKCDFRKKCKFSINKN